MTARNYCLFLKNVMISVCIWYLNITSILLILDDSASSLIQTVIIFDRQSSNRVFPFPVQAYGNNKLQYWVSAAVAPNISVRSITLFINICPQINHGPFSNKRIQMGVFTIEIKNYMQSVGTTYVCIGNHGECVVLMNCCIS